MGGVNIVYRFSVDGWVSRGKFSQEVQDSVRDRAEGTGCVGAIFAEVLQFVGAFFAKVLGIIPIFGVSLLANLPMSSICSFK